MASVSKLANWDLFISHAYEDKEQFVLPLVKKLEELRLRVWYDDHTLRVGDSISRSIRRGLIESEFGVVVLSKNFFAKEWPQRELDALETKTVHTRRKVILPIWYKISGDEIANYSLTLKDTVALRFEDGIDNIAMKLNEEVLDRKKVRVNPLQEIFGKELEYASGLLNYLEGLQHPDKIKFPEFAKQIMEFKSKLNSVDIDTIYENRTELTRLTIKLEEIVDNVEASQQEEAYIHDMDVWLGK